MNQYRKVYVIDDDRDSRKRISASLITSDFEVRPLDSHDFADLATTLPPGCAVVEIFPQNVPNFAPLELAISRHETLPAIAMCEDCNIQVAVNAIKLGAIDVYEKRAPVDELANKIEKIVRELPAALERQAIRETAIKSILGLSLRQFQVLKLVSQGSLSKNVAHTLNLSIRTVEMHREEVVKRLGKKRLWEAVQLLQSVASEKEVVERCAADLKGLDV